MKPQKTTKLKGSLLRETNRIEGLFQDAVPLKNLSNMIDNNEYKKGMLFPLKKNPEISFQLDDTWSSINITRGISRFNIVDSKTQRYVENFNLPSYIFVYYRTGMLMSYTYTTSKSNTDMDWIKYWTHRENGPAKVELEFLKYKTHIKKIEFAINGVLHNLTGPAIYRQNDLNPYRMVYDWYFYGKHYPFGEVKRMVKNPFNITKDEQLYLKLMLQPTT